VTDAELAEAVAEMVASVLGFPTTGTPPTRCTDASAAAVAVARQYLYGPEDIPTLLPDGPAAIAGLVSLAVRIFHDPASPGGVVGGDAYTGAALPEDLLAHVHHYLDPYRTSFGFA
jgi:hypothetical protein